MDTIKHYAGFPATGVSLRQMVQFGERPSTGMHRVSLKLLYCLLTKELFIGTLFRASQFLSEELPIRLAHRVQELGDLPDGLNEMPSIKKVQDWYSQSFEVNEYSPLEDQPIHDRQLTPCRTSLDYHGPTWTRTFASASYDR